VGLDVGEHARCELGQLGRGHRGHAVLSGTAVGTSVRGSRNVSRPAAAKNAAQTSRPPDRPMTPATAASPNGANADTPRPTLKQNPAPVVRIRVGNSSPM